MQLKSKNIFKEQFNYGSARFFCRQNIGTVIKYPKGGDIQILGIALQLWFGVQHLE
jgi:hypothetical protein